MPAGGPPGPPAGASGSGAGRLLWVVRHAHAAAGSPAGDVARPLDERGTAEAGRLAAALGALVVTGALARPDVVACSGAARARATADVLAGALGVGEPSVETELYRADADDLLTWVRRLPDVAVAVAVVGHNPAVSDLVDLLVGPDAAAPGMGTGSAAVVQLMVARWAETGPGDGRLVRLLRP